MESQKKKKKSWQTTSRPCVVELGAGSSKERHRHPRRLGFLQASVDTGTPVRAELW